MRIENTFFIAAPPAQTWQVLLDVPRIAPCLPGARLTEVLGSDRYKGEAAVKLGPVQLQFGGEAQLSGIDPAARCVRLTAKGSDRKGRGSAAAVMNFSLAAEGSGTRVTIDADLTLTGSIAQYGRASGLIKEIASELTTQFSANLSKLFTDPSALLVDTRGTSAGASEVHGSAQPEPTTAPPSQFVAVSGFRLLMVAVARMIRRQARRLIGGNS
jgi:carbon monoxide dehydrogenase subunit G